MRSEDFTLELDLSKVRLVVYRPELARKVNRTLDIYPQSTLFCEGDEVLFKVPHSKLPYVHAVLGIK